jgi:hypothetical protein
MKQIPLSELVAKSTPLPLRIVQGCAGATGLIAPDEDEPVAIVSDEPTATLLAHSANVLPALVKALETCLKAIDLDDKLSLAGREKAEIEAWHVGHSALALAQTVNLPE